MLVQYELFPLTPAEVTQRSKELAALVAAYDRLETVAKQAKKEHTEALKELRSDITRLARIVSHEQEYRDPYGRALRELGQEADDAEP